MSVNQRQATHILVTPPRCASYVRVSSSMQREDDTIQMQVSSNQEAISALGGVEVAEFRDEGVSGYSRAASQRQAVVQLVEAVQEGRVDVVVFFDESRLTRQILDFYRDVCGPILRANPDVKFYRSSDGVFWEPNSKEAKQNLILAYAESEKKARLARKSQWHQFHTLRQRPGARLPFGVQAIHGDKLVPDENFPVVLFIFELASRGYSERHIVKVLENMGLIERNSWKHTKVHYILCNPLYTGHLALGRRRNKTNGSQKSLDELTDSELIKNRYNALVPPELWELVHAQMRAKSDDKSVRTQSSFLLTGILRCSSCGELMKTQNSLKPNSKGIVYARTRKGSLLRYYWCPGCERRVDPEEIEAVVINRLASELSMQISEGRIRDAVERFARRLQSKIAEFDTEIQTRRLQLNHLEGGYYNSQWDEDTINLLKGLAERRIDELQEWKQATAQVQKTIKGLSANDGVIHRLASQAKAIDNLLPRHEIRALLMQMLERIDVHINRAGVTTIESIEYRTLPLQYISSELQRIDYA
jgi:DNA invertase Pin-like site-specific DNA recombinase